MTQLHKPKPNQNGPERVKADFRLEEAPQVLPPKEGWKNHTYYLVEVSFSQSNPVHLAILGVGFVGINAPKGVPGNYSEIWCNAYSRPYKFREAHYIKAIKELVSF